MAEWGWEMTSPVLVAAYSEDQAERLTGITKSQLRYWDRTDFFVPSYTEPNRRVAFSRVYSFRDIVALRVLNQLRNEHGVSLQHLRDVRDKLVSVDEECWIGVRLYVHNKRVYWVDSETKLPQEIASQQLAAPYIELSEVVSASKDALSTLRGRDSSGVGKIERNRYVAHNAPVVSGTRITVAAIKRFAEAGYSPEQIINEYPDLTVEDVQAALEFDDSRSAA